MTEDINRDLGLQPLAEIMAKHNLKPNDIVVNSAEQLSHKMLSRATKGRRLTRNVKEKILRALNKTVKGSYSLSDLFNY